MKKLIIFCSVIFASACFNQAAHAQLLKKLKDKVNQVTGNNQSQQQTNSNASSGNRSPMNSTGNGLSNTPPPDVTTNINNADKANADNNYSAARYALQQAIMGVEIQLGKQILQSLPSTVDGLIKDTAKNMVMSTQYGWNNLTMQAIYGDGKQKQMTVTIGNNPMYAGIVNLYFNNATYIQANNNSNDQNVKQVQVKGERAIIQFDQSKGYTLFTQMGQSSMIVWECVNFATEDEVMKAANSFDIDGIKKLMGEQ